MIQAAVASPSSLVIIELAHTHIKGSGVCSTSFPFIFCLFFTSFLYLSHSLSLSGKYFFFIFFFFLVQLLYPKVLKKKAYTTRQKAPVFSYTIFGFSLSGSFSASSRVPNRYLSFLFLVLSVLVCLCLCVYV